MGKTNRIYKNKDLLESKKYIKRRNEIITNRLLILFGLSVFVISFFIYAMGITLGNIKTLENITFAGLIITALLFIFSLIFLVYRIYKNVDESDKSVNSKNIFAVASFLMISDFIIYITSNIWIPFMTAFTIAVILLVYIYYLYQKEFFLFSVYTAIGCFMLYFAKVPPISVYSKTVFIILMAAFALLVLVFSLLLRKNKGNIKNKARRISILNKNARYFQFYILAVFIFGCAAACFFPVDFFYLICAILGYYAIIGVFFTVKMI